MEKRYSKHDLIDPEAREKIITEFAGKKWRMSILSIQEKGYSLEHPSFSGTVFAEFEKISTKDKLQQGDQIEVEVSIIIKLNKWKFRVKNGKSIYPPQTKQFQTEETNQFSAVSNADKQKVISLLQELSKFVSWDSDDQTKKVRDELRAFKWVNPSDIKKTEQRGRDIRSELNRFEKLLRQNNPNSETVLRLKEKLSLQFPEIAGKLKKKIDSREKQKNRTEDVRKRIKKGQTLSDIRSDLDHRIQSLTPSSAWTLLVDETGESFDSRHSGGGLRGRFVGVLIPNSVSLAKPLIFHAKDSSLDEIDKTLQALLDQPVGVFGIAVDDLPETEGERWVDGVMETIHWIWRLLPIDERINKSSLNILVEQRGIFAAGQDWNAVKRELMRGWAALDPERSKQIDISLKLIEKNDHPYNGYVDAVAFTWGSPNPASVDRLKKSGLLGTCLHEGNGPTLRRLWDAMSRKGGPAGSDWKWLVSLPASEDERSIAGSLLKAIGKSSKQEIKKWEIFFNEVRDHLESKAVNLIRLGRECEWLEKYKPPDAIVPDTLKLGWLISQLARSNHMGETHRENIEREIEDISEKVLEEDARLVCLADLHKAVLATNRLDFTAAEICLDRWKDVPSMVPGLQMAARVESSLGQHLAFQGHYKAAREKFGKAVEMFGRQSDESIAAGEKDQTLVYLAISTMDDPESSNVTIKESTENVIGPIVTAISKLAGNVDDRTKYHHHLLLRYLIQWGTEEEKNEYLNHKDDWGNSKGHPWQLIEFYRGLLLYSSEPELAAIYFDNAWAVSTATGQGPTVKYIGLCLGAAVMAFGMRDDWPVDKNGMETLSKELPLAIDRLELLYKAINMNKPQETTTMEKQPKRESFIDRLINILNASEGIDPELIDNTNDLPEISSPMDLLAKVLPFNFR